jgi:hypothetical protein
MQATKRQRTEIISDLLHVGNVSMQSLQRILARLSDATTCEVAVSGKDVVNANNVLFSQHRIEEPLVLNDGSHFTWRYASPAGWLATCVDQIPEVHETFAVALRRHPVSRGNPWRLVVAFDEFSPGNKLQCDNRSQNRKSGLLNMLRLLSPSAQIRWTSVFSAALQKFLLC